MTFLPIVDRELRAAARRKSTYRIRGWTAILGMVIGILFLFAAMASRSGGSGRALFDILTVLAGGLCLLTGIFLTADCISEEKREGTLGLLFLTDLKGYDVVLGKFVANSITVVYGLLALFPIMGISLLLGGVTGGEFWRTALSLVNGMFVSLAIGTCASACGRDARNTLVVTFLLLLGLTVIVPIVIAGANKLGLPEEWTWLGWVSPFMPFKLAEDTLQYRHARDFWLALLMSNFIGWFSLGIASWALPRTWQDEKAGRRAWFWRSWLAPGSVRRTVRDRNGQLLVDINPIAWLIGDERRIKRSAWAVVVCWGLGAIGLGVAGPTTLPIIWHASKVAGFLLKMLVAVQVPRFFADARQSGALELLVCTPLRTREFLQGQWLALRRIFLWPVVGFLVLTFAPLLIFLMEYSAGTQKHFAETFFGAAGGMVGIAWLSVGLAADLAAVGWFGMWLGLTAKKPGLAPAMTVFFVLILPSAGFCGLDIVIDLLLISWAVTRLNTDLRWLINEKHQPPRQAVLNHLATISPATPPTISGL